MRLTLIHDHKFIYANQNYYSTGKLSKNVLENYLIGSIENIQVICRTSEEKYDINSMSISSSSNIKINPIKFLRTKADFITKKKEIKNFLEMEIAKDDVVIIRLPSEIGLIAAKY